METVYVSEVNVYGQTMYKVVNHQALLFARLTGKKNLSTRDLQLIEQLGFTVTICNQYNSIKVIA